MTNATLVYFIPVGLIFMQNFICYTIYLVIANDFDYLWNIMYKTLQQQNISLDGMKSVLAPKLFHSQKPSQRSKFIVLGCA